MAANRILVFGAGGHSKVVVDLIRSIGTLEIVGMVIPPGDSRPSESRIPTYAESDVPKIAADLAFIAIGGNFDRNRVAEHAKTLKPSLSFPSLIHPSATIGSEVTLEDGVLVMAGAVVQTKTRLGAFSVINTGARVDHECNIGAFASVAPGVTLGGKVTLSEFGFVGLGSSVIHRISIGEHTVVGAGSVVLRDLPGHSVAYGNPCRVIRNRKINEPYL